MRGQEASITKIISAVFLFYTVVFLIYLLLPYFNISAPDVFNNIGEAIYNLISIINPGISMVKVGKPIAIIGWIIGFIITVLLLVYAVTLSSVLKKVFGESIGERAVQLLSFALTILFVFLTITSPLFPALIAVIAGLGMYYLPPALTFFIGVYILFLALRILKASVPVYESIMEGAEELVKAFRSEVEVEKVDLSKWFSYIKSELEGIKEASLLVKRMKELIEKMLNAISNKKVVNIDKAVNKLSELEKKLDIITEDLMKKHLTEEKIENIISKLENELKEEIINQYKLIWEKRISKIEIKDEKELYRAIMRELFKEEKLLKEIWETLMEEDKNYKAIKEGIEKIKRYVASIRHMKKSGLLTEKDFISYLQLIKNELENISNNLSQIETMEIKIDDKIEIIKKIIADIEKKEKILTKIMENYPISAS